MEEEKSDRNESKDGGLNAFLGDHAMLRGCDTTAGDHTQAAGYYGGMLAYYWVLATPVWGLLFGCYLYVAVNIFHVHYDEAFSALRIPDFKGFSRLHISPSGDLHVYSLAMDKVGPSTRFVPCLF